ncbi:TniB family NTP-binding protein [Kocuria rosea]|nr:TniB family NTP-binding protein [Kocuria rosea]
MTHSALPQIPKPIEDDQSLLKWESLSRLLGPDRDRFAMLSQAAYEALRAEERLAFDKARIRFMAGQMIITTGTIRELIALFTKVEMMNEGSLIGRRGVMLSAPASSGKSTACLALIQYYLSRYEKEYPGALQAGAVPVIYVSIPATRTIKGTLQRIARFLALPFKKSDTETELAAMLQEALPAVGTKVIVLDEVQMLNGAESTARPAVNNLKDLTNYFQGTIVYSGLNLTGSGLLFGDMGLQLRRRVFNVKISDFTGTLTAQKAEEWANIVGAFVRALPLYATRSEAVSTEAEWLHEYTGGNIGTLKAVFVDAAAQLILAEDPGNETLTPDLLKQSVRDYAAESGDVRVDGPAPLSGAHKRKKLVDAN